MIEILWQYDPNLEQQKPPPATATDARNELKKGNESYAQIVTGAVSGAPTARRVVRLAAKDLGLAPEGMEAPEQLPFAAVLSCSDARVPVELVLQQEANELFVVRVAGNTPGEQSMGSIDYAVNHLSSVRLLAVLGHTGCGAVTAAVDAYLAPSSYMRITADLPLRSIVDSIMTAVCGAADALEQAYSITVRRQSGYRTALIELAVIMNAALTAAAVRQTFLARVGQKLGVVYGVFNLHNHRVGLPSNTTQEEDGWRSGFRDAPQAADDFAALALEMAHCPYIAQHLL
jgi:carbonic anhydrase